METNRPDIKTVQNVNTMSEGSTVVGVVRHMGDVYYGDEGLFPAPSLERVLSYLHNVPPAVDEAAAKAVADDAGMDPASVIRLWRQEFQAHPPGATVPTPLHGAMRHLFAHTQRLGRLQRVVLLAETGMGKTPALRHVRAAQAAATLAVYGRLGEEGNGNDRSETLVTAAQGFILPLMVDLAHLTDSNSIENLLANAFNRLIPVDAGAEELELIRPGHIPALLRTYRCLLLLDNLDFLITNRTGGGLAALRHFMDLYQQEELQYLLTCRTISYRDQLGSAATLFLDDLTDKQVQEVLESAYQYLTPSLRDLVCNRAMLSLVLEMPETQAALADTESGQTVVRAVSRLQNKGELLRWQMNNRFLEEGQQGEPARTLLEGALEQLAFTMQSDHTFIYREEQVMLVIHDYLTTWRETVEWRAVLDAWKRRSLLEQDAEGRWRFCYRPRDQAFWAARAIYAQPDRIHPVLDEASDYWWRETLDILVGLVPDPGPFFFALMDLHPLVAASCIQYAGPSVAGLVTDAVIDALVEAMGQESSYRRQQIVERVAESQHPQAIRALFLALHREWSSLPLKALASALAKRCLATLRNERDLESWLKEAEGPALNSVRNQPVAVADLVAVYASAIANRDGSDPQETMNAGAFMAERLADRRERPKRRGLAAIYLGLLAGESEEGWDPLITNFCRPNEQNFVAWCVVQALTECPSPELEKWAVRLCSKATYRKPKWEHRRARALYLLGWISNPEETAAVLQEALRDEFALVRGFAVDAVARLNYPGALEEIHSLMASRTTPEKDPEVLRRMAEALGQIGTIESIPILQAYLYHERTRTRRAMQKAIIDIRQRHGLWSAPIRPNYWE